VLIEPGFIRTNFANAIVIAKKGQDPSSLYLQMMENVAANSNEMVMSGSRVQVVAKVISRLAKSKTVC
jgi:hypothetical protein